LKIYVRPIKISSDSKEANEWH